MNIESICETGPTVHRKDPRRLESLIICRREHAIRQIHHSINHTFEWHMTFKTILKSDRIPLVVEKRYDNVHAVVNTSQ